MTNRREWGDTKDRQKVHLFVLTPSNCIEENEFQVEILTYGATIRCIKLLRGSENVDVTLGCDKIEDYENSHTYLGCIVGRVANRIGSGQFILDGKKYQLNVNNGPNHLHGGFLGFSSQVWRVINFGPDFVTLGHISESGDEGYPGRVEVEVSYRVVKVRNLYKLILELKATCSEKTPINLSNHAYFNLSGDGSGFTELNNHLIRSPCDRYLPVNKDHLVTGEIKSTVNNSMYNFGQLTNLGESMRKLLAFQEYAYDNYFCRPVSDATPQLQTIFEAQSATTGISMEVKTTYPGFQFYTGDYLEDHPSKSNSSQYKKRGGFCVEAHGYPNAVNNPDFPSIIVNPGENYDHVIQYCFQMS